MKKLFLPILALFASALFSCKGGGDAVDLKLNLQSGSQYVYVMENKMIMEQSAMGQTIKANNDMTMEFLYDVANGTGSNKKITVTYNRIAMDMKSAMANISYDSQDSAHSDERLGMMGHMLHKPFTMEVTTKGDITRVDGLTDIINSMGDTTTPEGAAMHNQIVSNFNDSAMKGMMQQSLNIFPDNPVRPGDTWTKTYSMNMSMINVKMDNVYKLISVSNGVAHIEVNSKLTGSGGINGDATMKSVQINLGGDQKGNMDLEIASGLVTDCKLKQSIKGDISTNGMKIPLSMTQDTHITAHKK